MKVMTTTSQVMEIEVDIMEAIEDQEEEATDMEVLITNKNMW